MTFHICCRDCRFEGLEGDEEEADRIRETHESDTGHNVVSDSVDGSARMVTDGGRDTLRLTDDGIEIPEDVNLSDGVVFRARGVTVDHKPGSQDLEFYPALEERHLEAEGVSVQNEDLSEDEVSIKPYGEEARTYEVTVRATDGGENQESSPIPLYQREEAVPEDATDLILLLAAEDGATYETVREQLEQIEADAMHVEIGNIGGPVRADLGPYAQPKTREPFRSLRLLKSVDYVEEFSQAQYQEGDELTLTEKARQAVEVFRRGMLDEQREALEEIGVEAAPPATDGGEDEYPEPEEMDLEELREEYSERADIGFPDPGEHDRKMALWNELRHRVDVDQPPCPHCGEGNWGQAPGEPVQCNACGEYLGENPELHQKIRSAWDEIMGRDDEEELVTDGGNEPRQDDFEAYEEKLDQLNDALLEAYAAGFAKAVETSGIEHRFDADAQELKEVEAIQESHFYYWDGRQKPLKGWLRDHFLDEEELVTDGGHPEPPDNVRFSPPPEVTSVKTRGDEPANPTRVEIKVKYWTHRGAGEPLNSAVTFYTRSDPAEVRDVEGGGRLVDQLTAIKTAQEAVTEVPGVEEVQTLEEEFENVVEYVGRCQEAADE